jgi:uncharacterized protein involved in exopolysaccharide biosynthesis
MVPSTMSCDTFRGQVNMAPTPMGEPLTGNRSLANSDGVSLESYISVIVRYRWWILGATLVGAIAGFFLTASRAPVFEARANVKVSRPVATGNTAPAAPTSQLLPVFVNQLVAAQVLSETGLDGPPHNLTPSAFVKDHLVVEEVLPGSMLQARVRLSDAALAVKACNRLVAVAIELDRRNNADENSADQEFTRRQLETTRAQLEEMERRLLAFKVRAQVELRREEVRALLEARRELAAVDLHLAAERGRLAAATAELAQRSRTLPISRESNPIAPLHSQGIPSSEVRRDELPATGVVAGPAEAGDDVARKERHAEMLRSSRDSLVDPVYEILDYEVAASRVRVSELESRRRELAAMLGLSMPALKQFAELYERESEEGRLQVERDLAAKEYQNALTRVKQDDAEEAPKGERMKLVDPAVAAAILSRPSSKIGSMLGAAGGLGAGILLAFVLEFLRNPSRM